MRETLKPLLGKGTSNRFERYTREDSNLNDYLNGKKGQFETSICTFGTNVAYATFPAGSWNRGGEKISKCKGFACCG